MCKLYHCTAKQDIIAQNTIDLHVSWTGLCEQLLCFVQVREKIEMSGRDARWEFPKQLLFQRTNFMAEICRDLAEMVEVVDDFFKFLGPELKAVTGDTQGIDRVIQSVHAMVEPIENLPFNAFDQGMSAEWVSAKTQFANDNSGIQQATRYANELTECPQYQRQQKN